MKTLDEVIQAMEQCAGPYIDCDDCKYTAVNEEDVVFCNHDQLDKDALYYLKEYRKTFGSESTAAAPWNPERNRYCCDHCGGYVGKHDKFCPGCGRMLTDWAEAGRKAK